MKFFALLAQRHAKSVLIVAALLLIAGISYGTGVFSSLATGGATVAEHSQSDAVDKFLANKKFQPDAVVLFKSKNNDNITAPAYKAEIETLLTAFPNSDITSYFTTGSNQFVSRDNTQTFATVTFKSGDAENKYQQVEAFQSRSHSDIVTAYVGGSLVANKQVNHQIEKDLSTAELISLPILAILLLFFFRSVVAASLPLIIGVVSIIGGLSVVRLLTSVTDIDQYAINVITVLGLGLSVDYSLLMVNRFREEIKTHPKNEALRRTVMTSGKTILFSGLTVMVSLLALTIFPISFLRSVGIGGASALVVAMFAALTIMPAMLSLLGKNIDAWRIGPHHNKKKQGARWRRIGELVMRFPLVVSGIVIALILVVASPALHMEFKTSDFTVLPHGSSARIVGEQLDQNFDNQSPPILVVYRHDGDILSTQGIVDTYNATRALENLDGATAVQSITSSGSSAQLQALLASSVTVPPALSSMIYDNNTTVMRVSYTGDPAGKEAQDLITSIRALQFDRATIEVGGDPAIHYDVVAAVSSHIGWALLIIAVAMFVLLALLLRSFTIPLAAIVINTFALLATFGILVVVFQYGHGTEWTWLLKTGGIDITIPVLIFAIAFGLSMDYAVFLYSRIREEYDRTKDTKEAILQGLALTGPLITQAAILLFVVVAAFASSKIAILQQIGVGLALTVLIDAFVVRIVFVPAVMQLFGKWNWWAPKWLNKISIKHE